MSAPTTTPLPAEDLTCPLCSYNLHGLTDPRCPECGYSFTWDSLREARRTVHPYLFEHHPERNARSFLHTLTAGLLPRRFWRTLAAPHPIRPGRLLLYNLLVFALLLPMIVVPAYQRTRANYLRTLASRLSMLKSYNAAAFQRPELMQPLIRDYGSVQEYVDTVYPPPTWQTTLAHDWPTLRPDLFYFGCLTAWPLLTLLVLTVYRRSTRQAAVRRAQIARCCVYSADISAWLGLSYCALFIYDVWLAQNGILPRLPFNLFYLLFRISRTLPAAPWLLLLAIATYRLTAAHSLYLKMPRAWLAIPLAQLIVLLIDCQLYVMLIGIEPR